MLQLKILMDFCLFGCLFVCLFEKETADGQCTIREIVPNHSVNSSHSSYTGFSYFSLLCQSFSYLMTFLWPSALENFLPAQTFTYHHHLPKPDYSFRFDPDVPTLDMPSMTRCPFQPFINPVLLYSFYFCIFLPLDCFIYSCTHLLLNFMLIPWLQDIRLIQHHIFWT